jgi:hypothetical protein
MRWTSQRGTVINIPDGLSPDVIKKWKARANEGYGTEAQKMLDKAAKKLGKNPADGGTGGTNTSTNPTLDQTTGRDGNADSGTTGLGDTGVTLDNFLENAISGLGTLDLSGAPKILNADDLASSRQSVYDSQLALSTRDFETDKARELEARKQELAER